MKEEQRIMIGRSGIMLEGKIAIVTGGTRGIGYEIALKFLKEKATVIIFGSKEESVEKAIEKIKNIKYDYSIEGYYPNLGKEEEIREVFQKIYDTYGNIDILVNNAGISSYTNLTEYEEEEVNNIININLKAVFTCSKIASSFMEEKGGVILNTSSMVSLYGQKSGSMYPATKEAVNGLTKSLARELGKKKIRVNAVAPGVIETDMVRNLPKEKIEPLIGQIPLGRMGTGEDVANAFLFLASDMASYISGEILQVDGALVN